MNKYSLLPWKACECGKCHQISSVDGPVICEALKQKEDYGESEIPEEEEARANMELILKSVNHLQELMDSIPSDAYIILETVINRATILYPEEKEKIHNLLGGILKFTAAKEKINNYKIPYSETGLKIIEEKIKTEKHD